MKPNWPFLCRLDRSSRFAPILTKQTQGQRLNVHKLIRIMLAVIVVFSLFDRAMRID